MLYLRDENGNVVPVLALKGKDGSDYVLTEADKQNIAEKVVANLTTEDWTFTLEDGSTVNKSVVLK